MQWHKHNDVIHLLSPLWWCSLSSALYLSSGETEIIMFSFLVQHDVVQLWRRRGGTGQGERERFQVGLGCSLYSPAFIALGLPYSGRDAGSLLLSIPQYFCSFSNYVLCINIPDLRKLPHIHMFSFSMFSLKRDWMLTYPWNQMKSRTILPLPSSPVAHGVCCRYRTLSSSLYQVGLQWIETLLFQLKF